jgi:hypothetical protein
MGSKKKQTIGYEYSLGYHLIFCHGPVDKVTQFTADKKTAWIGNLTSSGTIGVNAPNLFGGQEKEGGIAGLIDFMFGDPAQGPNSYLPTLFPGQLIPNFRGLLGMVARQIYVGTTTYLKNNGVRAQRIHKRTADGIAQWYDAKSEIIVSSQANIDVTLTAGNIGVTPSVGITHSGFQTTDTILLTLNPLAAFRAWAICSASDPMMPPAHPEGVRWRSRIWVTNNTTGVTQMMGNPTIHANWWQDGYATPAEAEANWPGDVLITGGTSYTFWIYDDVVGDDSGGMGISLVVNPGQSDMNPAHIIRECLTDPDWGMGYNDADIDDASFMSILWNKASTIEEFINEIVKHIDASVFIDRATGKFVLKLIRNDYVVASLPLLDESIIQKVENFAQPTTGELTNSVTVKYWDAATNTDRSITVQDIALVQMQQGVISTSIDYPGFSNPGIAARVAQRDLVTLSTPIISCTLYCNQGANTLSIGSVFKWTWPDFGITNLVMRVTGAAYGDGKNNRVRLTVTQDIYSVPSTPMILPEEPDLPDPNPAPIAAVYRKVYEVPYLEAVQQNSQTTVDNQLASNPDIGYAGAAAARPQQAAINAQVYTTPGVSYDFADNLDFSPVALLNGAIDKLATTFPVDGVAEIAGATAGSWVQCGNEIMVFVAYAEPNLTVKRGALDTVPEAHADNEFLLFWDAYSAIDEQQYVDGESIDVKITPTTGAGPLDLAAAPVDTVVMDSRMIRPYAPGQFKINTVSYPAGINAVPLTVTWVHRDRLLQTGSVYLGTGDAGVGPEPGTTYNVRFYNDTTSTLLHSETGITGITSTAWDPVESAQIRVELESVRGGFVSYQKHTHVLSFIGLGGDRVTEAGDFRLTELGDQRILE